MVHDAAAEGFSSGADAYVRARPSYPDEVVDRIVAAFPDGEEPVLDLAAGTGMFTSLLVARGVPVVAVEPVAAMSAKLRESHPHLPTAAGTAEEIPLRDASVRAVTVAQAFHWFDAPRAFGEVARVLVPGGVAAVVFNVRDDRHDWVARITEIIDPYEERIRVPRYRDGSWRPDMEQAAAGLPIENTWTVDHVQPMDVDRLVERVASTSFIARLPLSERALVEERVRALAETHPDLRGNAHFAYPYRCETTLLRKP